MAIPCGVSMMQHTTGKHLLTGPHCKCVNTFKTPYGISINSCFLTMTFEKHVIARMILCVEMKMSDPSTLATVSPSLYHVECSVLVSLTFIQRLDFFINRNIPIFTSFYSQKLLKTSSRMLTVWVKNPNRKFMIAIVLLVW